MLRRSFLASLPLIPAAAARPRRVRLGIRTAIYQAHPMAEAARLIRAAGFEGVHLGLRFADVRFDPEAPDWSYGRRAREVFGEAGLKIAGLDAYFNIVHPDSTKRQSYVLALQGMLEHARDFGTPVLATETGTFHPDQPRNPQPDDPVAGWKQFIGTVRELLKAADAGGAELTIEPSLATVIGTVEQVRRMLHEVPGRNLKILWDAAHYFTADNIGNMKAVLNEAYSAFGSRVVLAHANDCRLNPDGSVLYDQAGAGQLDYTTYVSLLDRIGREIYLCLEHCKEPNVPEVKAYVAKYLA